jgi:hypothetical protein
MNNKNNVIFENNFIYQALYLTISYKLANQITENLIKNNVTLYFLTIIIKALGCF